MNSVVQVDRPAAVVSQAEIEALSQGCAWYRPGTAVISVVGNDRVRWLNGMISNNVRDLVQGQGVYAFVLNAQGQIQGDLYVFNLRETLLILMEEQQKDVLLPLLRRYIIMDKVELRDLSAQYTAYALLGAKAEEVLVRAGVQIAASPLSIVESDWNGSRVTFIRGDNPCVPSFWLISPTETEKVVPDDLRRSGAREISSEAVEALRILCGIPRVGADIREKTLPQETGQEQALNFNKGCYIGQEIVERVRARGAVHRVFTGFELQGSEPLPGAKIQSEGKDVGELTSVAQVVNGDERSMIALGYIRREAMSAAEKQLTAGDTQVRTAALPFRDLLKSQ